MAEYYKITYSCGCKYEGNFSSSSCPNDCYSWILYQDIDYLFDVILLDTETGEIVQINNCDINALSWAEGNWSDDCNRVGYFGEEVEEQIRENLKKEHPYTSNHEISLLCLGAFRFLLIYPFEMKDENYSYDIFDLNANYPLELVNKFLSSFRIRSKNVS
jgi:hypothetical protein